MPNSQPVRKEAKESRSKTNWKNKIKEKLPKKKAKPEQTSSDKLTRKEQKAKQKAEKRKGKKPRRRAFPIWLRIIVVLLLSAIALIVGAMVGYGVIGDGKPTDALEMDTWRHIFEIVTKTQE